MQIPLRTSSGVDAYVRNREWRAARLSNCPMHPEGGCSFVRHGSYPRLMPQGIRVARWYCPRGRRTFSLLPDFLAARLPGLLAAIEDSIAVVSSSTSIEAAADVLRGPEVTLPGAVRWLRRRVQTVRTALDTITYVGLMAPSDATGGDWARRIGHEHGSVLVALRRSFPAPVLSRIPAPLGFAPSVRAKSSVDIGQQGMGPDVGFVACYVCGLNVVSTPCGTSRPIRSPQRARPPPKTSFGLGAWIVAFATAAPPPISNGSGDSAPIRRCWGSLNKPN